MKEEIIGYRNGVPVKMVQFSSFAEADEYTKRENWAMTPAERHKIVASLIYQVYGTPAEQGSRRFNQFTKHPRR